VFAAEPGDPLRDLECWRSRPGDALRAEPGISAPRNGHTRCTTFVQTELVYIGAEISTDLHFPVLADRPERRVAQRELHRRELVRRVEQRQRRAATDLAQGQRRFTNATTVTAPLRFLLNFTVLNCFCC
jgi:hypothetical protein